MTSWHDYPGGISGRTERRLLDWFRSNVKPGDTWLDVGAHYGYTAIALSRLVGRHGRVFTFEPIVASAGCVAQAGKLNGLTQLTVMPLGLGVPQTYSTLRLPVTRGMADSNDRCRARPMVRGTRLRGSSTGSGLHISGGIDAVDGVKIDVQGMERRCYRACNRLSGAINPKSSWSFIAA